MQFGHFDDVKKEYNDELSHQNNGKAPVNETNAPYDKTIEADGVSKTPSVELPPKDFDDRVINLDEGIKGDNTMETSLVLARAGGR